MASALPVRYGLWPHRTGAEAVRIGVYQPTFATCVSDLFLCGKIDATAKLITTGDRFWSNFT